MKYLVFRNPISVDVLNYLTAHHMDELIELKEIIFGELVEGLNEDYLHFRLKKFADRIGEIIKHRCFVETGLNVSAYEAGTSDYPCGDESTVMVWKLLKNAVFELDIYAIAEAVYDRLQTLSSESDTVPVLAGSTA